MKWLVCTLWLFPLLAQAVVETNGAKATSRDPFSAYQWGLSNQGQLQTRDIDADDLRSEKIHGLPGFDLGFGSGTDFDSLMKRDTVVALLDTGVDTSHEDLAGAFALNQAECVNGRTPAFPQGDLDGNGYIGDCSGWDFVAGSQRVQDVNGHGTHLAGIIAARRDNGKGIRGISQRVKILPLTVMGGGGPVTDRVLKAMQYAIARKVDVINLSLGWPYAEDSSALRDVFHAAAAQGIVIVAAAGNDGTSEPVFPCAYKEVLCVGSSGPDGSLSSSSNFGSQVDLLAPGEDILSTIPKSKTSTAFAVPGYDFLSGSSQSAAAVAGMAAILRGIFPNESADSLYFRLAAGARPAEAGPGAFVLHGMPSMGAAIQPPAVPLVQPLLKEESRLLFSLGEQEAVFPLRLKAFSGAGDFSLSVSSDSAAFGLNYQGSVGKMAAGEERVLLLPGKILNSAAGNQVNLTIRLLIAGRETSYHHQLTLARRLSVADRSLIHLNASGLLPEELGTIVRNKLVANLVALNDPLFALGDAAFFFTRENAGIVELGFLRKEGEGISLKGRVKLPNARRVLGVHVVDINRDGVPDLMIDSEAKPGAGGKAARELSFFSLDLHPLFGEKLSTWRFEGDLALFPAIFSYIPAEIPGFGKILLPSQVLKGKVPSADLATSPFSSSDQTEDLHFFYFLPEATPQGVNLLPRVIDTKPFRDRIASELKIDWRTDLRPRLSSGTPAALLLFASRGTSEKAYQLDASDLSAWRNGKTRRKAIPDLSYSWTQPSLADTKQAGKGVMASRYALGIAQQIDEQRLRWAAWKPDLGIARSYNLRLSGKDDILQKLSGIYFRSSGALSAYVLSRDYLQEQTIYPDGSVKERKAPITRFSYVAPELMNLLFQPFFAGSSASSAPAFYVNATALNRDYVYVIRTGSASMEAPAELTLQIPENCAALGPVYAGAAHQSMVALACRNGNGQEIVFAPVGE